MRRTGFMRGKMRVLGALPACLLAFTAAQAAAASAKPDDTALRFHVQPYAEQRAGKPGYSAKLDFLETDSAVYPHAAEIGRSINSQVLDSLFSARQDSATEPMDDFCADRKSRGEDCANELYMQTKGGAVTGSIASVRYDYSYFPVGAAHPMHSTMTYNFSLKPVFRVGSFSALFTDADKAFPIVQRQIRTALLAKRDEDGKPLLEQETVWQGTAHWQDFDGFLVTKAGIAVIFSPYAVAPYAFGTQEVTLPYAGLQAQFKPFYRAALGLQ